ncbi:hypothetical protein Ocin01_06937 [Orchesella cincta]|uniref:Uncharacterized protein n=1 Tax=Orchesella cincta TaxID=48709 RepID=A0A1D2N490_ORCCI|nr:hypothetical protein Ocin01_06937 [Orchesella cincta]
MDRETLLVKRLSKIDIFITIVNFGFGMFFVSSLWNVSGLRGPVEVFSLPTYYCYYMSAVALSTYVSFTSVYFYHSADEEPFPEIVKYYTKLTSICSALVVCVTAWLVSTKIVENPFEISFKWGLIVLLIMYRGLASWHHVRTLEVATASD